MADIVIIWTIFGDPVSLPSYLYLAVLEGGSFCLVLPPITPDCSVIGVIYVSPAVMEGLLVRFVPPWVDRTTISQGG
jgi:hypothetical protein